MFKKPLFLIAFCFISGILGSIAYNWAGNKVTIFPEYVDPADEAGHFLNVQQRGPNTGSNIATQYAPFDFVKASAKAMNTVVYIKTQSKQEQYSFNDWFFGDFFGKREVPVISSGSGVIVSKDGYIVTNNHVVEKADQITVIMNNKDEYNAKLIGTDPSTDLALLKIESDMLPYATFFNSNMVKVGEWVVAVGNPFNLTNTVTAGIVSAKGRNLNIVNNAFPIESFIQTDAAINPGNSGGALLNINGDLVGINTAIYSRTGAYNGYGFAIPSNIVSKVIRDLKELGKVQRAFIGAEVANLDFKTREQEGIKVKNGAIVTNIEKDGPGEDAGLKENDVIQKVNGIAIESKGEFDEQLSYYRPGEQIKIKVIRNNQPLELTIKLVNIEGSTEALKNKAVSNSKLGGTFEPVSKFEKEKYNINNGVKITEITGGILSRMGIPQNFIITAINRTPIQSVDQLTGILENLKGQVVINGVLPGGGQGTYSFYIY